MNTVVQCEAEARRALESTALEIGLDLYVYHTSALNSVLRCMGFVESRCNDAIRRNVGELKQVLCEAVQVAVRESYYSPSAASTVPTPTFCSVPTSISAPPAVPLLPPPPRDEPPAWTRKEFVDAATGTSLLLDNVVTLPKGGHVEASDRHRSVSTSPFASQSPEGPRRHLRSVPVQPLCEADVNATSKLMATHPFETKLLLEQYGYPETTTRTKKSVCLFGAGGVGEENRKAEALEPTKRNSSSALDERRHKLRMAKLEWKRDVLILKAHGIATRNRKDIHKRKERLDIEAAEIRRLESETVDGARGFATSRGNGGGVDFATLLCRIDTTLQMINQRILV